MDLVPSTAFKGAALLKGVALGFLATCLMVIISTFSRGWERVNQRDYWIEKVFYFIAFSIILTLASFKKKRP